MSQKTITISGKRYTARQIARLFDTKNMTVGGDYIVTINGRQFFANYRLIQDDYFSPVCSAGKADSISITTDSASADEFTVWLRL